GEWAGQLASVQPLILVFEDIHWGEDPLLELIEHLAMWVRESPLLLIALARPELLNVRPGWGGGRMRAASIELDPLRESEARELVDELLDSLLLRDFVLNEPRSTIIGERAFRFKHMLIREVAYSGLTKAERATLHRRFAEWLHERGADELLEIRAYHLDHAAQLLG